MSDAMTTPDSELKPAEGNPWYRFFVETIRLDKEGRGDDGRHWLATLHYLIEQRNMLSEFSFSELHKGVPDGHPLKGLAIQGMDHHLRLALHHLIQELGNPETLTEIDFSGLLFNEPINFSRFIFPVKVSFARAKFLAKIDFNNAVFFDKADFNNTVFNEDVSLRNTVLIRNANFNKTVFCKSADFIEIKFNGGVNFEKVTLHDKAIFEQAQFKSNLNLTNTIFLGEADFTGAGFYTDTDFTSITFSTSANFSNAHFDKNANFTEIKFPENTSFSNVFFSGNTNFTDATFSGDIDFLQTTFTNTADFTNATFSSGVAFERTTFSNASNPFYNPNFTNTTFSKIANFQQTGFAGRAFFENATFLESADFSNATFSELAQFIKTYFRSVATFYKSEFHDGVMFSEVKFLDNASFNRAKFSDIASFIKTTFCNLTLFNNTSLEDAEFSKTLFEIHAPRFYDTKLGADITWELDANFWPQTKKHEKDENTEHYNRRIKKNRSIYENLASHMKRLDKYHDEHFFYRQEMRCRRVFERSLAKAVNWLYDTFSDYGYGIGYAFSWWLVHIGVGVFAITIIAYMNINWGSDALAMWQSFGCSIPVSFANAHSFLSLHKGPLMDCHDYLKEMYLFNTVWTIQTILGIPLLFFILLTLRVRFRLK